MPRGISWRVVAGRVLLAAAVVCLAAALWAAFGGGLRLRVLGVRVTATDWSRPAFCALVLGATGLWLDTRRRSLLAFEKSSLPTAMLLLSVAAAAVVVFIGLGWGTKAAGGADVHGYVSQAYLWLEGDLRTQEPLADKAPWPFAAGTFAPLGYRAGADGTIVPTYSPGIPLLMAGLIALFGPGAEYWLTPFCAGALVLLTYALGRQLFGHVAAAVAAIAVATSPLVLQMACWLLGDLPAATFWLASIVLALRATPPAPWFSGALAGIAILIRPNLVVLSVVPLVLSLVAASRASRKQSVQAVAAFALACAPAALFIGWLFNHLYGSPLRSGYGASADLFKLEYLPANLKQYPAWLFAAHGLLPFLFPLAVAVAQPRIEYVTRCTLAAFPVLVFACYAFYAPFDAWWYTRFLLPALPVMYVLATGGVWSVTRNRKWVGGAALAIAAVLSIGFELKEAARRQVTGIGAGEQKYAVVGEYVRRELPSNAVVYSMQHSGNIRHYSGRRIIRWDLLEPAWLDRSVEFMRGQGFEPYVLLAEWEVPQFRARFSTQRTLHVMRPEPLAEPGTRDTYVYAIDREEIPTR